MSTANSAAAMIGISVKLGITSPGVAESGSRDLFANRVCNLTNNPAGGYKSNVTAA
jgi:hypothetical protein